MVKIIKNGRVIDPESRFDGRADLWIENGKIQKIVKKDTKSESDEASDAPFIPADAEVLDAEGLIVACSCSFHGRRWRRRICCWQRMAISFRARRAGFM